MKKQIRKLFLFFVFLITTIFLLSFSSCDTTNPPPPTKSPRDYTWKVDTLGLPNTFQTLMYSIWGSSENDVYTCGHVSGGLGGLWHYDGKTWEAIDLTNDIGIQGRLQTVHGTADNNVWVVGSKSKLNSNYQNIDVPFIIQFDGVSWKKHEIDTEHGIYGVYVVDRFETWACGEGGIVYHYKNFKWELDTLDVELNDISGYNFGNIVVVDGSVCVMISLSYSDGGKRSYIFKRESEQWKLMDLMDTYKNMNIDKWGRANLRATSFGKLFSIGSDLFERGDMGWEKLTNYTYDFRGFGEAGSNNMIIVGSINAVHHYNGSDWSNLILRSDNPIHFKNVWLAKNNAFIIGNTSVGNVGKTLVFHKKQNPN